ncbi:uncharacterized protein LTR77_001325 [Saxophila tyrrhenica]|uniref:Uncharacterized protein n=1 Tax=Saxophila tyrrhenica TaxID=1690608 RepID=A0AAV9PKR1_9PEZI|nr:hypothetical protein LTR77_001325 [Saxophila tyrrhenica]
MDESSGHHLSGVLQFDDREKYDAAQNDGRTKELLDDIGKGRFTRSQPIFLTGGLLVETARKVKGGLNQNGAKGIVSRDVGVCSDSASVAKGDIVGMLFRIDPIQL